MQYINIHTHNTEENENIKIILNVFAHEANHIIETLSDKISSNTSNETNQLFSIGLHPWHLQTALQKNELNKNIATVKEFASHSQVWAVGETGLDKIVAKNEIQNYELQKEVFYQHIKISEEVKKPLIIHCVRAYYDVLAIKKQLQPKQSWIFHGFNANTETAKQLLKENCYLSFGYNLFDVKAKASLFFREMPLEYLFLETDTLQNITKVYQQAAMIKNISEESIRQAITQNFLKIS